MPIKNVINEAAEDKDPNSCLNYFRKMVKLRKSLPELVYGAYQLLTKTINRYMLIQEHLMIKKLLVIMNFSDKDVSFTIPASDGKTG